MTRLVSLSLNFPGLVERITVVMGEMLFAFVDLGSGVELEVLALILLV